VNNNQRGAIRQTMRALRESARSLERGTPVTLKGWHPWAKEAGTLIEFDPDYGVLHQSGWLVELDNGTRCYAQPSDIAVTP
jgi:hypothetical protein